ncbi:MAG: multicopper oxidase family protein [bacterium]
MSDLTRRDALALGAALGGAAALGGVVLGAGSALAADTCSRARDTLPRLPVIRSRNGLLRATLVATQAPADLMGRPTEGLWTYNGHFPGPCLVVSPGDRLDLTVRNETPVPVNTHYHGCWVNPSGDADNVFVSADPGDALTTRLTFPREHPSGLFWYHPHVHGYTNDSVWSGLAGPLFVRGGLETLPQYRHAVQRLLVFKGFALDPEAATPTMLPATSATSELVQFTANGALNPTMLMRPGETQIWRMVNASADGFLRISLDDHRMTVLAVDGVPVFNTWSASEYILVPGARVEVAVTGSPVRGSFALRTLGYRNGPFGQWLPQELATIVVDGPRGTPSRAPKTILPRPEWLMEKPKRYRVFTLSESYSPDTGPLFYINGKVFDHQDMHDPFEVEVDTVEEWVVRNDPSLAQGGAAEGHPFHIHVNHFAVVGRGRWNPVTGKATSFHKVVPRALEDTEQVLPGEYVVLRTRFRKFTGKTVFHCHILFHEDLGMMGAFRIVKGTPDDAGDGGGDHHDHH